VLNHNSRKASGMGATMKAILSIALILGFVSFSTAAEVRIGTVDLQKVMGDYYKWQQATNYLKEKEVSYYKELEGMRLEGRKLTREAQELRELAENNALSSTQRDEKKRHFELKLTDLREFEMRYDDVKAQREAELQNYSVQTRKKILDEVISATRRISEQEGFNLVLNANKANPAAGEVLFSKNVADLTDKVVSSLNATKPLPPPTEPNPKAKP
jgi:Skp family chaperone for outer membrane proteins